MGKSDESPDHPPSDTTSYPPAVQPGTEDDSEVVGTGLEEHLRRITDGFFALDEQWRFTYLNERADELINPEDKDLIGEVVWDKFPDAIGRKFESKYRYAMENQVSVSFEEYYPEPLDTWFEVRAYPSETGLSVYFRDITERKQREHELEKYETLTQTASDVVVSIDPESTIRDINPAVEDVFGYAPAELIGDSLTRLMPDDLAEAHREGMRRYLQTGEKALDWDFVEVPGETADGNRLDLEVSFSGYTHGDELFFTGIIRDVTEQKRQQRQMEAMYDRIADAFLSLGPDATVQSLNDKAEQLLMLPKEQLLGECLWDPFPEEFTETFREDFEHAMETQEPRTLERYYPYLDRWYRGRIYPSETGASVYYHDITDERRQQQHLERSAEAKHSLYEVATSQQPIDEKLESILDIGRDYFDLDEGFIANVDRSADRATCGFDVVATTSENGNLIEGETYPLAKTCCQNVVESERIQWTGDAKSSDWVSDESYEAFDLGTYIGARLTIDGEVWGTIGFIDEDTRQRGFTDAEQGFMEIIAQWTRFELSEERHREQLHDRIKQQHAVARLGQDAVSMADMDQAFDEAVSLCREVLDVDAAKVLELMDRESGIHDGGAELLIRAGEGFKPGTVGETIVPVTTDTQAGYTLLHEEPIITTNLAAEERFTGHDVLAEHDITSGITVIIGSVEDPWGVLGVHDTDEREFSEHDTDFVQSIANVLAETIERIHREQQLERRIKQQRAVADLGQQSVGVSDEADLDHLFHDAAETVADVLDNAYCKVLDLDPEAEELLLRQGVGWQEGIVGEATVASNTNSQAGFTLLQEEPVIVDDLDSETRFTGPDLLTSHDVVSGISVIIGPLEDPWGILGTHDTEHREFTEYDADFVQSVANILADTIDRVDREQRLDEQREHLAILNECYNLTRDIAHTIVDVGKRETVEQEVCDRLIGNALPFTMSWIGSIQYSSNEIEPTYSAGDDAGYLDEITIPLDDEGPEARGPGRRAIRTHEPQVVSDMRTDETIEPWRQANLERGHRSAIAVPLVHDEFLYGLLAVYSPEPHSFDGEVRDILAHLGELIGHTIHSLEQNKALSEDAVVTEVEYTNTNIAKALAPLKVESDGDADIPLEIRVERVVQSATGYRSFIAVDGAVPNTFIAAFEQLPTVECVDLIQPSADPTLGATAGGEGDGDGDGDAASDRGPEEWRDEPCDNCLFVAELAENSLSALVDRHDGRLKRLTIDEDDLHLVAELPPTVDVREFTESVQDVYPGTTLAGRRTVEREWLSPADLRQIVEADLTQRQRDILETAHMAGYFDSPREHSGEEVAEMLGVSGATFSQHLRAGQRKLFDAIF